MVQIIKKENNKEVVRTEDQMNSFAGNMWKQGTAGKDSDYECCG
jgi:hypothetical protein